MQLIEKSEERLVYRFHPNGREQLVSILNCFPLPSKWDVVLSRNDDEGELEEDREFLEESLDQEREAMKSGLEVFLNSPVTFYEEDGEDFFRLGQDKVEWLLQVLNDIRISAWQLLGSPGNEEKEELEKLIQENIAEKDMQQAQLFILLELAGYYQAVIIESLSHDLSDWDEDDPMA